MSRIGREQVMHAIVSIHTDVDPVGNGDEGSITATAILLGRGRVTASLKVGKGDYFFSKLPYAHRHLVSNVVDYFRAIEAKPEGHADRNNSGFREILRRIAIDEERGLFKERGGEE